LGSHLVQCLRFLSKVLVQKNQVISWKFKEITIKFHEIPWNHH
jgi:hypothetical protein